MSTSSDDPIPLRPAQAAGTVAAWASIGLWQVWLSTGDDLPLYVGPHAIELAVFSGVGLALVLLRSWPWLANPMWALVTPAAVACLGQVPTSMAAAAIYLVGMVAVAVGLQRLASRFRMPALLAAVSMPASLLWVDLLLEETPVLGPRLVGPLARPAAAPAPVEGRSVVLISVDTLRWDRVAGMGSVDRLKARGAWWERAMSTSSWTLPALASVHTGLSPQGHGATCLEDNACQAIFDEAVPLAERLAAEGYDTAAVASNPWTNASSGMSRGFRRFRDLAGRPPRRLLLSGYPMPTEDHQGAEVVVDAALGDVDSMNGGAFFLWVHFIDPHLPYKHEPEDAPLFGAPSVRDTLPSEAALGRITAAYDAEVAAVDRELGRLLDELEARGVLDEAIVVFTADHGEEFLDHGDFEHGHHHHTEVVDVPLVVIGPGIDPGQRTDLASLVDVTPTVLGLLGLSTEGTEGLDLRDPVPARRIATAHGNLSARFDCSARQGGRRVLVEGCNQPEPVAMQGYDTVLDPTERHPLPVSFDDPLLRAASEMESPAVGTPAVHPAEALRALGYVD